MTLQSLLCKRRISGATIRDWRGSSEGACESVQCICTARDDGRNMAPKTEGLRGFFSFCTLAASNLWARMCICAGDSTCLHHAPESSFPPITVYPRPKTPACTPGGQLLQNFAPSSELPLQHLLSLHIIAFISPSHNCLSLSGLQALCGWSSGIIS